MNLPLLIQKIYGEFTFTGLYSFEFVDKSRNTITELFFMLPPKTKNMSESTRSSTVPTLGGNYNVDGGNATKTVTLTGDLYFPYIGSPDNPVARDNAGLENTLNGLEEFLRLRWMLIRYRDYVMTKDAKMTVPTDVMSVSKEISQLYKKISKKVKNKTGALYNEIQLIFHDYDLDDHFYCRVDNFSANQTQDKHIVIEYTITIECYEVDTRRSTAMQSTQSKPSTNESTDVINTQMQQIDFDTTFDTIQPELGNEVTFLNTVQNISDTLEDISTENEDIQAGKSTASTFLPIYVSSLLANTDTALNDFINTFLSVSQKTSYESGDTTIDELVSRDLLIFYNSLQKVKLQAESLNGVLISIVQIDELRYSTGADDYTLTEEQFDSINTSKVENDTSFYYYTIMEGDTARIIAQRELGDQEKFIKILQLNNITENDFIENNLIGDRIKIPFLITVTARGEDNLVWESDYNDAEKFIFGSDLSTGINQELLISETGDLAGLVGIENSFNNIENRINNGKGTLNIFNPNWGTISIDDSNAPLMVRIGRYLDDIVAQIQADPRVESVEMDLNKLEFKGESISVPTKIFFIGTEKTKEVIV